MLLACLTAGLAPAPTFYGSVVGTVSDASGAAVVEATVVLINTGTIERRSATTDLNGAYQFLNLVPAVYKV
jgi:hypothetical protein